MTVKFFKDVRKLKNSTLNLSRILTSTIKIAGVNCVKAELLENFGRKAEILVVKAADFN